MNTEAELWERLFSSRHATCLVVSHRRPALRRATSVLLMDGGRIVARGPLDELLGTSPLMQDLWVSGGAATVDPAGPPPG